MVLLISYLLSALACSALYPAIGTVSAGKIDEHFKAIQRHAADRFNKNRIAASLDHEDIKLDAGAKNFVCSNPAASAFYVDGKTIPDIDWDIGPSWAGLLPISGNKNETRKLFFWFFPPGPKGSHDSLTIWLNGGPGCSSLAGMLQENGPFLWSAGQRKPTINEYSWTNLSSMLYVEQPVGTGFSQGVPNIVNEDDLAAQFVGFLQQFLKVFQELKGKKTYLTGESYAGYYIPYIADYIYQKKSPLDLSVQGVWLGDPLIGSLDAQAEIPAVDFVRKYEHVFAFNQTFLAYLEKKNEDCKYAGYLDEYLRYPPKGLLPLPRSPSPETDPECDVWSEIYEAASLVNTGFNPYRIFDMSPIPWSVLGFPGSTQSPIYFNRTDVKKAIHAPLDQYWAICTDKNVFVDENGDTSLPPAFTVLPSVIEKSSRSVIMHGLADFVLIAEGARIVLQNMTWGGKQGFQNAPNLDSFVVEGMGAMGTVQNERNLSYYEVSLSGHMVPGFVPQAAYQSMEWLMGKRNNP